MALRARHRLDSLRKDGIGLLFIHRPRAVNGAISLVGSPKAFPTSGPSKMTTRLPATPTFVRFDRSLPCRNADFRIFMMATALNDTRTSFN